MKHIKALIVLLSVFVSTTVLAETIFMSDQLRPVGEAQKVRTVILKGAPDAVEFIPEEGAVLVTKVTAEQKAGKGTVDVIGSLHGTFPVLDSAGALSDVDGLMARLQDRGFSQTFVNLGKLGGSSQKYIPWMQATYIMAANNKAMKYLPAGADINRLTYAQLKQWAKNIYDETGDRKLGFPAGPKGLMHRFFQGYLYPSYTNGVVRSFKSKDAEAMWADFRDLWQYVNPRSTSYDFMQEPLLAEEVWIAFDHTARLKDAFAGKPKDFVGFAAPAGKHGRGFMPVVVGLAIPKTATDRDAAERLIDHLTKSSTQSVTLREVGFYPVVAASTSGLPADVRLSAAAINAQANAPDANPGLLPVGLGDKSGAFSKVYRDTFQLIVLEDANVPATLRRQGRALDRIMRQTGAPCWAPDASSGKNPCPVE